MSVILPAYNEASNLVEVVPRLLGVLEQTSADHEVLVVDDGSDDGTADVMGKLSLLQPEVQARPAAAQLRQVDRAAGRASTAPAADVIVLMDADGQDQPEEIPKLLAALDGGLDLATGRRAQRNDRFIKRNTSRIYNRVTASVTGVQGLDFNSGLKAMRREVVAAAGPLRRAAPLHPGARRVGGLQGRRGRRRARPAPARHARSSAARASGAASSTC